MSEAQASADIEQQLERGAAALGLSLTSAMVRKLLRFVALLEKWNRVYNLTAIRDHNEIVSVHLLDSLVATSYLEGDRGIDVGTGAGFPGIPLAIATPSRVVTLLDSNQKKAAFLRQATAELELPNTKVVCERVEQWKPARGYDWVISRAFAQLGKFIEVAGHLVGPQGRLVAMKGAYPREEIKNLPQGYRVREVISLSVPGLRAERHLVLVERQ